MSLNWNVKGIKDHENVCFVTATDDDPMRGIKKGDRILNPVTNGLIWATMGCGIGWGVTEENVEEFVARLDLWQHWNGGLIYDWDEEAEKHVQRNITAEEVRAHVGLSTNVAYEKRAEWLERMFTQVYRGTDPVDAGGQHWVVVLEWNGEDGYFEEEIAAADKKDALKKAKAEATERGYSLPSDRLLTVTIEAA